MTASTARRPDLVERLLQADRRLLLLASMLLLLTAALADWSSGLDVSLGVLYVLPILPAAIALERRWLLLFAILCALARIPFLPVKSPLDTVFRFLLSVVAHSTTGLFISELVRNRRLAVEHYRALEKQQSLRQEAEEHLRALAESSPAAIFTLDERAGILSANQATGRLLGLAAGTSLSGHSIADHLPVLADALKLDTRAQVFRTAAQCQGRQVNGSVFVAQIWFSTYQTPEGRRLAAIAVDSSEETREREEQNLRQLLSHNRIIAGAVSHEIRNVCGAISLVFSSLTRTPGVSATEDFRALGTLVQALERIAATELQSKTHPHLNPLDLREVLNHLRIIIEPAWQEAGGSVRWDLPRNLPPVLADAFGLTQAFLNLTQNSLRAVADCDRRELHISAARNDGQIRIAFEDSGPGVQEPQKLFEPFQQGADHVGLGLYVSRAILRSYGGDLRYVPASSGCRFVADLRVAAKEVSAG